MLTQTQKISQLLGLILILYIMFITIFSLPANAEEHTGTIKQYVTSMLEPITNFMAFLFLGQGYEIFGNVYQIALFGFPVPLIVLWLLAGAVFFTIKLGFVNIKLFGHAIACVRGKYSSPDDPGSVTHFEALSAAVSGTVGIGNIAGVAIAVTIGGPGAVIWMMLAAFFGMSTKFAEVTLGHKYRHHNQGDIYYGGPFYYLKEGLKDVGKEKTGKILSIFFAISVLGGAIGIGNMFQANQAVAIVSDSFSIFEGKEVLLSIILAIITAIVIIGGIKRIAHIAEAIVPIMAIIYVVSCIIILLANFSDVGSAIILMFKSAFDFSGNAFAGGIIGVIIQGFRRAAISNECGIGTASIAHSTAKTTEPVREGCVALLEPFIDTIVICFLTGIVVTVTGVYIGADISNGGILITSKAFATVFSWFPYILSICATLFAYSTIITYCYYAQQAWSFLFSYKTIVISNIVFISAIFVGGVADLSVVIDFSDMLMLLIAVPNLLGLYFMVGTIKKLKDDYVYKLKNGEFNRKS